MTWKISVDSSGISQETHSGWRHSFQGIIIQGFFFQEIITRISAEGLPDNSNNYSGIPSKY